jgi:hypothetical protein
LHRAAGEVGAFEAGEVFLELRVFAGAVLEAAEIGGELGRGFFGEVVNHPLALALDFDEAAGAEVGEVFGDFHLRLAEDVLEVADAERALREEVKEAQAGDVAEAFVDADEFHEADFVFLGKNMPQGECFGATRM